MEKKKFDQKALITVNALRVVLTIFTTTFLTSHILTLTPDNIMGQGVLNVGILYLSQYIVYILTYYVNFVKLLTKFFIICGTATPSPTTFFHT